MGDPLVIGRRIARLAAERADQPVVTLVARDGRESVLSWAQLEARSNQVARYLTGRGVGQGDIVATQLGNSLEHFIVTFGTMKVGGCILPLNQSMPEAELEQVLAVAGQKVFLSPGEALGELDVYAASPVPERSSNPAVALASGGSTGRPKIIVSTGPVESTPDFFFGGVGHRPGQVQLVSGPMFHNGPFIMSFFGILYGDTLVVMEKFDAERWLDLVERHRIQFSFLVPTTMRRIAAVPGVDGRDLSSIEAVVHSSAPCPPALKRRWIDLVGATHLYEGYGASEGTGGALIRGDEWLLHPGSVGRPYSEIVIAGDDGLILSPGEVGEIYSRMSPEGGATHEYRGAPAARSIPGGYVSVGDMGWLDAEGYLYIADRRTDMIISGGENIFPAEVEAALAEHPGVGDVVVVGLSDDEWGQRVHAVIQSRDPAAPPSAEELDRHSRRLLASYKVPRSYEFVTDLGRNEAGKLRRQSLVAERALSRPGS